MSGFWKKCKEQSLIYFNHIAELIHQNREY